MIIVQKASWYEDSVWKGDSPHSFPGVIVPIRAVKEGRPIRIKVESGKYKGVYAISLRQWAKAPRRAGNCKFVRINNMRLLDELCGEEEE